MKEVKFRRETGFYIKSSDPKFWFRPRWNYIYMGCKLDFSDLDGFVEEYMLKDPLVEFKHCLALRWKDKDFLSFCEFNSFP